MRSACFYAQSMEIHLTPDQEEQLSRVANSQGKPLEQLLTESATYVLRENDPFLKQVEEGIEAADRGDFLREDEMDAVV